MKQGILFKQMFVARNNMTVLGMFSQRNFVMASKKVGHNDSLKDA